MIGTFASRIDASVLAEGIEHLGELDAVVGLGVPLGAGVPARPARAAVVRRRQRAAPRCCAARSPRSGEHNLR